MPSVDSDTGILDPAVSSAFVVDVQSKLQQTPVNSQKPTSEQSSSVSIDPFLRTKTPPLLRHGWSSQRDHHDLGPIVCEPPDATVVRIRHNWVTSG